MTRAAPSMALTVVLLLTFGCGEPMGPHPAEITVSPSSVHLSSLGDTERLVATVRDNNGSALSGTVMWEATPSSVASVSPTGLVTAEGNGSATVTARSGTLKATVPIDVAQRAASVVLSPDPVVLEGPGDEVTVTASVVDAGGSEISVPLLSWSSDDPGVATVDDGGRVRAVASGSTTLTVEAGGEGPGATSMLTITVEAGVAVEPAGGEVSMADDAVHVALPSGAVADVVFLSAEPATELPQSPVPIPGTAYDMGPDGIVFDVPVTLTIAYDPGHLPMGLPEEELRLQRLHDGEYELVSGGGVNVTANTVFGEVEGFSTFAVLRAIEITTTAFPDAFVDLPYGPVTLTATGVDDGTWTVRAGALPLGVDLSADGEVVGTPTEAGAFAFTVEVTAGDERRAARELAIEVRQTLAIITSNLPNAVPGVPYEASLEASGGDGSYTWAVTVGALPEGLELNEVTGAITGTPTGVGTTCTVQVTSSDGQAASEELTITMNPALEVTTTTLPDGAVGASYGRPNLAATGGDGSYAWTLTVGGLPDGLELSAEGAITGTPTAEGTSGFTVQVMSGDGQAAERVLSITVDPSPPTTVEIQLGDDQVGYPGTTLPFDVEVRVIDANSSGVEGVEVFFGTADGGTVDPVAVVTGANGVAASSWTLGADPPPDSPGWRLETVVASVEALGGESVTFEAEVNRDPGGTVNSYDFGEVGFYGLSDDPEENEFRDGGGFDPVAANNLVWLNDVPVVVDSVVIVSQAPISGLVTEGGIRFVAPTDACPAGTEVGGDLLDLPFRIEVRGRVTEHLVQVSLFQEANCTGS